MMSLHRYLPSCVQSGGLQTLRDLVCCSSSHQVSQNNMLLLGVVQMVIGVLIVGSSFSAFFLSNFPAAIHNTSPYWAGLSGLLCGAVGVIAWKHNSMFTTTFYALLSSLCIVLNLLGAVLTSKISQNLVPIQNCPCFCCTSPDGCGAYFLPSSNAAAIHESLDVNKLPNKTSSSSSLSSFRSTHDNHHSAFNPQQQQLQYVKPLPTCEHEAETLRALMIVLCIENCLACAIATLSTIISLLLIAKNKTPIGSSGNQSNSVIAEAFASEDTQRHSQHRSHRNANHDSRGRGCSTRDQNSRHSAAGAGALGGAGGSVGLFDPHLDPHFGAFSRTCPWVLWHAEMQALLPPPYLPPPYTTSDNPANFGAPFVLLNGPGFEVTWETDSLPPPYSSCDLVTSCRIRGTSPEVATSVVGSSRLLDYRSREATTAASCSSVLSHNGATNHQKKLTNNKRYNWYDQNTVHRSLRPSKSLENMRRAQQTRFRSTHYLYRYHPIAVQTNGSTSTPTQQSIVMVYKQNRLQNQRRFGSDGALQRVGFWHEVSKPNRKFKSTSTLTGLRPVNTNTNVLSGLNTHPISSSSTSLPVRGTNNLQFSSAINNSHHHQQQQRQQTLIGGSNDFLTHTEGILSDGSRAIQTLSTQIASAGVSALEKIMTIKNHFTGTMRPPSQPASPYYSALVNERINEETSSQILFEDCSECSISMQESESAEVFLKDEIPSRKNCDYMVELPPMAASSSSENSSSECDDSEPDEDHKLIRLDEPMITITQAPVTEADVHYSEYSFAEREQMGLDVESPISIISVKKQSWSSSESSTTNTPTVEPRKDRGTAKRKFQSDEVFRQNVEKIRFQKSSIEFLEEKLPPSRYDYPSFLTIPLDQPEEKNPIKPIVSKDESFEDESASASNEWAQNSSIELYSTENSSSEGDSPILESKLRSSETLEATVRSPVRAQDRVLSKAVQKKAGNVMSNIEYNGDNKRQEKLVHKDTTSLLGATLSASGFSGRRFSGSDYEQVRGRRNIPTRHESARDYEHSVSLVANRESEYIRQHRSRNASVGSESRVQAHSTTNIYMSLLNIIQQSHSLMTDLALHYQQEIGTSTPSPVLQARSSRLESENIFFPTSPNTIPNGRLSGSVSHHGNGNDYASLNYEFVNRYQHPLNRQGISHNGDVKESFV